MPLIAAFDRRRLAFAVAVVGVAFAAALTAPGARAIGCGSASGQFSSTGAEQEYVVPAGVHTVTIAAIGAPGGAGTNSSGGKGAAVSADITVTPCEALYVEVGGPGADQGSSNASAFNGGGASPGGSSGGGGGASDVRTCSISASCATSGNTSLASRLLVAGGGGGGGADGTDNGGTTIGAGGSGGAGGAVGSDGTAGTVGDTGAGGGPGGGATQQKGGAGGPADAGAASGSDGSFGSGGAGGDQAPGAGQGGGGGGGYFGGGGGGQGAAGTILTPASNGSGGGGGGGGSSWVIDSAANGTIGSDTTGTPSVSITPELPVASIAGNPLSFGSQTVGTTSSSRTVTVTNTGKGELDFSDISVGGTDAGDFNVTDTTCTTVAPNGGTCTVSVAFTPQASGSRSATLSLTSNDPSSPASVALDGTGTTQPPTADIVSGSPMAFGSEALGGTSAAKTVTIQNNGQGTLNFSGASIEGADPGDFSLSGTTCGSVAPGSTCTASVVFAPQAAGSRTATLTLTSNAPSSPTSIPLSGTGTAQTPTADVVSGSPMAFGTESLGGTSTARTVTIKNNGQGNLTFSGASIGGANAGDFFLSGTTCGSVAPGATCTASVEFAPQAAGSRSATLTLTSNAPSSPTTIALSGTGVGVANQPSYALLIEFFKVKLTSKAHHSIALSYVTTLSAKITLVVRRGNKVVATISRFAGAGRNTITWDGRVGHHFAAPGNYTLQLQGLAGSAQFTNSIPLRLTRAGRHH